jgi:hypothetical protein
MRLAPFDWDPWLPRSCGGVQFMPGPSLTGPQTPTEGLPLIMHLLPGRLSWRPNVQGGDQEACSPALGFCWSQLQHQQERISRRVKLREAGEAPGR